MTVQLDLFDQARPTAVARAEARRALRHQVEAVLRAHPRGVTDWEIHACLGRPEREHGSIVNRRRECGAVEVIDGDGRPVKRPSPMGSPCTVWTLPREAT